MDDGADGWACRDVALQVCVVCSFSRRDVCHTCFTITRVIQAHMMFFFSRNYHVLTIGPAILSFKHASYTPPFKIPGSGTFLV